MTASGEKSSERAELNSGVILVAFEKLFGGGRGVGRYSHSGLRYVNLSAGAVLVEQNPKKHSKWAQLANDGHRVAWVIRERVYLARVIDGEVLMLEKKSKAKTKSNAGLKSESNDDKN